MSKRARNEISQTFSLSTPSVTSFNSYQKGLDVPTFYINTRSKAKGDTKSYLTLQDITDILCPITRVQRVYRHPSLKYAYLPNIHDTFASAAWSWQETDQLFSSSNAQGWASYVMMPTRPKNPDTLNLTNNWSGLTLQDMIFKQHTDGNSLNINTTVKDNSEAQLCYLGGFTQFTVVNVSNTDQFVTFHVSKPKRPLHFKRIFADGETNPSDLYGWTLPCLLALQDKKESLPQTDTIFPTNDNTYPNDLNDLLFSYQKTDKRRIYNWTTSTTSRKLAPGQTTVFKISHPPFKFLSSEWVQYLDLYDGNSGFASVDFMPFCTQVLDIQFKGEMVVSREGTIDPHRNLVGRSAGGLLIETKEYHTYRNLPYSQKDTSITTHFYQKRVDADQDHINEENQEIEDTVIANP